VSARARVLVGLAAAVIALAAVGGWLVWRDAGETGTAAVSSAPSFVGSAACVSCHPDPFAKWKASQHAVAMQEAGPRTVLGDFRDARFTQAGVETTFQTRDGKFFVRTEGADGQPAEFEVKYTFGVAPLQQYLLALPGGRLQALTIAWDTRPKERGGQKWFSLHPGERIPPDDERHWTGRQYNWNSACADCHATSVKKGYNPAGDHYATTWAEISVGCEACHGPASAHLAWADAARKGKRYEPSGAAAKGLVVALDERKGVTWTPDPATGAASRSRPRAAAVEIDVCAQCHSRRGQVAEGYEAGRPFVDHYRPALLEAPLYHPDGQQRDEVYDWGSFLSSRMHQRGVTCSDCHEPHGAGLRAPGNAVCLQCHAPARYDTQAHHLHRADGPGAACATCHMPTATYMVIDPRHDHSLRVPRPDLSGTLGVPNSCTACHRDRSSAWAASVLAAKGRKPEGFQRFAETFAAADAGRADATAALSALAGDASEPPIVRGSALLRLAARPGPAALAAARRGLGDGDPLVRYAALRIFASFPPQARGPAAALLGDPARVVRLEAASVLSAAPTASLSEAQREALERAAAEYLAAERLSADRAASRVNLGSFLAARGRLDEAERELRSAIAMDRHYVPAYVNLADAYRMAGRERDAEATLREGLGMAPGSAALHHALGLSMVRSGQRQEGVVELGRAAAASPGDARMAYVYAIGLDSLGKKVEALRILEGALARRPEDRDILAALVTLNRDAGHRETARRYARRLVALDPRDPAASTLLRSLE